MLPQSEWLRLRKQTTNSGKMWEKLGHLFSVSDGDD